MTQQEINAALDTIAFYASNIKAIRALPDEAWDRETVRELAESEALLLENVRLLQEHHILVG